MREPGSCLRTGRGEANEGAAELEAAIGDLARTFPGDDLLVERMIAHDGIELIVGAFRDLSLGPSIMLGAGGILAELYRDVSFRLVPISAHDAREMIGELRIALVAVLIAVSALVAELDDRFEELDLNPLVHTADGWVALDAKLGLRPAT